MSLPKLIITKLLLVPIALPIHGSTIKASKVYLNYMTLLLNYY